MSLAERVRVARRFQKSIRIDTDLPEPSALEGFVCPPSSALALQTMAQHVFETGQAAFTWTGPYGAGKSSLAVALAAALNGRGDLGGIAAATLGSRTAESLWNALPPRDKGWRILPVVGRRDRPAQVVGEALESARLVRDRRRMGWSDEDVFNTLTSIAKREPRVSGGLVVLIDEMGKFLEGAAQDGTDIYFFQQLAELASRSDRRLIVIGILHQAFEEYAHRLSREMRDEWAKIQGRFVDLAIAVAPDEQLDLLSRAIESDRTPSEPGTLAGEVASLVGREESALALDGCWPLHPVVACLLGPISRRRFGQNQRSLFAFLNSTEPQGFQDFLRGTDDGELYPPDRLWDYLRVNLEPSILASPDGHRWALAVDAVERQQASGSGELRLRLLKTIGLIDLFRERSGLVASLSLLQAALQGSAQGRGHAEDEVEAALDELAEASLVIHRKFTGGYGVFEGSDFDIEQAVEEAHASAGNVDFARLTALAGLQPIVAKRHYHETGALRWYDMALVPLNELADRVARHEPHDGSAGAFFLALPQEGDSRERARQIVCSAADTAVEYDATVGFPQQTPWNVIALAEELLALEHVRDQTPELQGDRVARLEVEGRIIALQEQIERELDRALDTAQWYGRGREAQLLDQAELNGLASDLADKRFNAAPRLHNELLNRLKPSSNAIAAQNVLLRRMAIHEGEPRLGIEGFPAEGGLFASLLEATGLYAETPEGWRFVHPDPGDDPFQLAPAWRAAEELLRTNSHRTVLVSEIYAVWQKPPFGIKEGLLPVLTAAFMLSSRSLACYRDGIFQARITDLDMDFLGRDARDISLRWMDLSEDSRRLLSEMAEVVRELDDDNELTHLEPIDVARGLVAIYDRLPEWVGRTQRLSENAKRVRHLFKQAKDPNRLIFDDIPATLTSGEAAAGDDSLRVIGNSLREGLTELRQAYPSMLHRLKETLLTELQVPNGSAPMLAELRARAENVRELGGDHRQEAFIVRLTRFSGGDADIESLASMAVNKPSITWVDADIDRAAVELATMARTFVHSEVFAHVKGRTDKRHAMAVVVGKPGDTGPVHDEFDVTDLELAEVAALISQVESALQDSGEKRRHVILAALAELSARYLRVE